MNSLNESNNLIERMSVDQISVELLKDHYVRGYLMNRNRLGIPLRERLENRLKEMAKNQVLAIDLDGIQEMTTSVAEEIGPKLFEYFLASSYASIMLQHVKVHRLIFSIRSWVKHALTGSIYQRHVKVFGLHASMIR